ncbi:MAG: hypothetical protein CVU10_10835 [Bacteroidetes bacterium HGW-Bacteroidetes-5]|jgi:hypothetical protein|nr:MAG: hypothetical protein CVU10_10835 [Bacteroidetes bacterium HGW-Bacteroidetes-5]
MDSTIISILAAVAIMAYQIFSEKKKRERKAAMKSNPSYETGGYEEKPKNSISALFADILEDDERDRKDFDYDFEDPYASITSQRVEATPVAVKSESKIEYVPVIPLQSFEPLVDTTPRDIYDSAEIADHDYESESALSDGVFKGGFDPAMLIIYSEIAAPKFRD